MLFYGAIIVDMKKTFPFGLPILPVGQVYDGLLKKLFILGVYASAVHVKWYGPDGRLRIRAMAVASEPEIFWRGGNDYVQEVIERINLAPEYGYLAPADEAFNGPSGRCLDENYINPLGLTRDDVWLCDLLPESRKNISQEKALRKQYDGFVDIDYNFPRLETPIADEARIIEIASELETSGARRVVLLGDEPIKYFMQRFKPEFKSLSSVVPYGSEVEFSVNSRQYTALCLAHPRQTARLGKSNLYWFERHREWLAGNVKTEQ